MVRKEELPSFVTRCAVSCTD